MPVHKAAMMTRVIKQADHNVRRLGRTNQRHLAQIELKFAIVNRKEPDDRTRGRGTVHTAQRLHHVGWMFVKHLARDQQSKSGRGDQQDPGNPGSGK